MKTDTEFQAAASAISAAAQAKAQWIAANLKEGESYAGLILGVQGEPDYHLILLPGEVSANWNDAKEFAAKLGGELPTRREQALLYANLKHEFKPNWHWSSEQHAARAVFAWSQFFNDGGQYGHVKSLKGRARAVRRLAI